MKKVFISLFIFALTIIIANPTIVRAKDDYCWNRSLQECASNNSLDSAGNRCATNGSGCYVKTYSCDRMKFCTCYQRSDCPSFDEYGNVCSVDGDSCKLYKSQFDNDVDDIQDNYDTNGDITCGSRGELTFNRSIANITHYMVLLFQIFGPVMLIILGAIDLTKAVTAGKDDDIKKAQSVFVKRLTMAIIMFLVITIVRILLSLLSTDDIKNCFDCFVNGANKC